MKILTYLSILIEISWCEYDTRVLTTLKYSKYHVVPTIVNGHPAQEKQIPYLVALMEPIRRFSEERVLWASVCGGSIISELRVLTAAHCFELDNFYFYRQPDTLRLVAGSLQSSLVHSPETDTTDRAQWRKIDTIALHKDFVFPDNDIALILVDKPWSYTEYVNFIVPATIDTDYPQTCHSCGFGRTGQTLRDIMAPVLMEAKIEVMPEKKCSILWEMDMRTFICTSTAVTDVAVGDSGGPLACKATGDPAEQSGKELLVGIVSGKNYDKTSLFTRISRYSGWIDQPESLVDPLSRVPATSNVARITAEFFLKCVVLFLLVITFLILK